MTDTSEPDDGDGGLAAARYALGVASLSEMAAAEARLDSDPEFARLVTYYDGIFAGLERYAAPVTPPSGLWDRIDSAIDDEVTAPATRTIRGSDMAWEPFVPGIARKVLFVDTSAGTSGVLYRVDPGAGVGGHGHAVIEECLVLEGEIEVDGVTVRAGDLHVAFAGQRHASLVSRSGAIVYIRGDIVMQP